MSLKRFLTELEKINTQKSKDGRIKPHKLIMLLSVLDLIVSGEIVDNKIFFSQALIEQFVTYFNVVAKGDDLCQPGPPFFHLRSSDFWNLKVKHGKELTYSKLSTSGGGVKRIFDNIDYAYMKPEYYNLLLNQEHRNTIRNLILNKYFTSQEQKKLIEQIKINSESISYANQLLESNTDNINVSSNNMVRDIAFRRVILRAYDMQCAVCGFRVIFPTISSPIDAAHLIPWSISHNDNPTNGIALCKLHHWAVDSHLISPTNDMKWKVSTVLDPRRNSENQITLFDALDILLPREPNYYPSEDSIEWCLKNLLK